MEQNINIAKKKIIYFAIIILKLIKKNYISLCTLQLIKVLLKNKKEINLYLFRVAGYTNVIEFDRLNRFLAHNHHLKVSLFISLKFSV